MFYAFEFTDGINTTTGGSNGSPVRIAGTLYSFHTKELRSAFVAEGCDYRNGPAPFRRTITVRELPHGWTTKDAQAFSDDEPAIFAELAKIDSSWLNGQECAPNEGHWAYPNHAQSADEFRRRLDRAEGAAELAALRREERKSVEESTQEAKELIISAMVARSGYDATERAEEAERILNSFGQAPTELYNAATLIGIDL
jgi:hypothetical protein